MIKNFPLLINRISTGFIITGILILLVTFAPVIIEEFNYQLDQTKPQPEYKLVESQEELENQSLVEKETTIIPNNFDFSLVIPKIGINSSVSSNVDSGNPDEYLPILQKGVAHALNSSLPDEPGSTFIFAHSTDNFYNISRYNAVFFLLRKLDPGEDIYLFYKNKKYHYQVTEQRIVSPEEVPEQFASTKDDSLILQTCYPPGTTINRLLLFAKPV